MAGRSYAWVMVAALLAASGCAAAQEMANPGLLQQAQRQSVAFFARVADLTCTETVLQEKIRPDGHVQATQRSQFDYLIMVRATRDELSLNESRIESGAAPHKPLPMLVTNGFSMLLLILHPYYQDSFRFTPAAGRFVDGRALLPVEFEHLSGTRSPAALALRGREYPLDLRGTVWVDQRSGQVVQIEATLAHDMSDSGLRSLHVRVDYKPSLIAGMGGMPLPGRAVIDLETPRQHWRNTHVFSAYKSFSTAVEQATTAKVITPTPDLSRKGSSTSHDSTPREQH